MSEVLSNQDEVPSRKDLLDIASLSEREIRYLLDTAEPFKKLFKKSVKKVPTLRGKSVLNLFYEPSTRTSSSFEVAETRLIRRHHQLHGFLFLGGQGRVTARHDRYPARDADRLHRDPAPGRRCSRPRCEAHRGIGSQCGGRLPCPSRPRPCSMPSPSGKKFPEMGRTESGRRSGISLHSRVARSTSTIFHKLGMEVAVMGPGSLVPRGIGIEFMQRLRVAGKRSSTGNLTRSTCCGSSLRRQEGQFFPGISEYHQPLRPDPGTDLNRLRKSGIYLMHPGPVNRGVELVNEAMDYEKSLIKRQVENGIAVRMAALYWLKPETGDDL